jgi:hypothetical protein
LLDRSAETDDGAGRVDYHEHMASVRTLVLLLSAILLLAGFAVRPALAAPCPHGSPAGAQAPMLRATEAWLSAAVDRAPIGAAMACCTPSCCLAHCPVALAEVGAWAPEFPADRYRPGTIRLAAQLLGDGPWRPPPLALVS